MILGGNMKLTRKQFEILAGLAEHKEITFSDEIEFLSEKGDKKILVSFKSFLTFIKQKRMHLILIKI